MAHEWLTAQDATLRCVETDDAPLQVGALCLFEAESLRGPDGRVRLDEIRRRVEQALVHVPHFRQVIVSAGLGLGRPAWVDDARFDVAAHVRAAALPPPGGHAELRAFVRQLLEAPLDRTRPLWELWVVDGVDGDRIAVVPKASHVAADGIALLTFALSLFDAEPGPAAASDAGEPWTPEPATHGAALWGAAALDSGRRLLTSAVGIGRSLARPRELAASAARTFAALRAMAHPAPRLPMTRPIGRRRGFAWTSLRLEDIVRTAHEHGATVNDVVLTIVGDALAARTTRAGGAVDGVHARVIVPVSLHATGSGGSGNAFSLVVVEIPLDEVAPVERLRRVHEEMQRCKVVQARAGSALFSFAAALPPKLLRRLGPTLLAHQPFVNLAVTNIAGVPEPMRLLGARLLEAYPFISLTGNLGMIIGVVSHDGDLGVGITVDPDLVGDVDAMATDIARAARALTGRSANVPAARTRRAPRHVMTGSRTPP